jgi:hypothetical protein
MKDKVLYYQIVDKNKQRALSVMIATKNTRSKPLLYEDSESGVTRALRYAENKKTPFEDEQTGQVILSPIVFEDGVLKVEKSRHNLVQFLELHPDNVKNGGHLFKLRDFEEEASQSELILDIEDKARDMARELTMDQYLSVHRIISRNTDRLTSAEVRRDVRIYARNNPEDFLSIVDDPETELNGIVGRIFEENLVSLRKNNTEIYYNLPNNKSMVTRVPKGKKPQQHLEEFFKRDEGLSALSIFEESLVNIDLED